MAYSFDIKKSLVTVAVLLFLIPIYAVASQKTDAACEIAKNKLQNSFTWADYTVLSVSLIISCGIGIFYGFFKGKQTTTDDFLLGGSSMGSVPMALSLIASFITAIEMLGYPAEIYNYGTQFWMICIPLVVVIPFASRLYLPVFMKLKLTSSYEYLAIRFSPRTRLLASGLYVMQMVLYTSVTVYAPALALSRVTGLNLYLAVTVVYLICVFYASQGGMKAVIMTDTFQSTVLIVSLILVLGISVYYVGGPSLIWAQNEETHRIEFFNMSPNPTVRHSFWSVVVGGFFYWMTMYCSNQASIQKYLSVQTIAEARIALWVSSFGMVLIFMVNFCSGMVLVAHFWKCDPLTSGSITASDEILPLYVISEMNHLKGVAGFFVAGIFAASLSTIASALNSLAAVTCKDFVTGLFGIEIPVSKGALWAKWISVLYGVLSFALVFVVEQLGSVMQVALSFNGMVGGITLGLFSLGMFFPWPKSKAAIIGATVAMVLMLWMGLGQQVAVINGTYVIDKKPTSIEECPCFNSTIPSFNRTEDTSNVQPFYLYRISYLWYSMIGFLVTIVVALLSTPIVGIQDPKELDADLISPALIKFYNLIPNKDKREDTNIPLNDANNLGTNDAQGS